jgi:hypothetical protein
MSGNSSSQ